MFKKIIKYIGLSILLILISIFFYLWYILDTTAILKYNNSHHSNNKYIYFIEPMYKMIDMRKGYIRSGFSDKFNNFIMPTDGSSWSSPISNNITKVKNRELFLIKGFVTYTMAGEFHKNFKMECYILEDANKNIFVVETKIFLDRDRNYHNIEDLITYIDNKTQEPI